MKNYSKHFIWLIVLFLTSGTAAILSFNSNSPSFSAVMCVVTFCLFMALMMAPENEKYD